MSEANVDQLLAGAQLVQDLAGTIPGADQHTWTCVLDCTYGYGSEGLIADLRDPAHPKLVGNWIDQYTTTQQHDVTGGHHPIVPCTPPRRPPAAPPAR